MSSFARPCLCRHREATAARHTLSARFRRLAAPSVTTTAATTPGIVALAQRPPLGGADPWWADRGQAGTAGEARTMRRHPVLALASRRALPRPSSSFGRTSWNDGVAAAVVVVVVVVAVAALGVAMVVA